MLLSALLTSKAAVAALSTVLVATGGAAVVATAAAHGRAADVDPTATSTTASPSGSESTDEDADDVKPSGVETKAADEPDEDGSESPAAEPTRGPDATGPAKHGLCTAWAHGGLTAEKAVAGPAGNAPSANLVEAAGGADKVAEYCADVLKPGKGDDGGPSASAAKSGTGTATAESHRPAGKGKLADAGSKGKGKGNAVAAGTQS